MVVRDRRVAEAAACQAYGMDRRKLEKKISHVELRATSF